MAEQRVSLPPVSEPLHGIAERVGYECASHNIYAAPGMRVFVEGTWSGRRQTLAVDPDEIDELCKRLHQAKRYARRNQPSVQEGPDVSAPEKVMPVSEHVADLAALREMYDEACAEEVRLSQRLNDCEEALADALASEEAFREEMLIPFCDREGRTSKAVQAMSWDEMLGVASRNSTAAQDAERSLAALREAAQAVTAVGCVLHTNASTETWLRYTAAIQTLRAVLASADSESRDGR